jgi:putative phosphoesterase
MTKIMVISDTHDDPVSMDWTLNYLETEKLDTVIHLGDYYDDASILEEHGHDLIRVPGTWDTCYYPDPNIVNRKFIEIEGWRLFLSHTPESHYNDLPSDIKPESIIVERNADIFLYGHTHIAEIEERKGMVFINPGHMYNDDNRGYPMTFSILEIDEEKINASIVRQKDNKPCLQGDFDRALLRMPMGI